MRPIATVILTTAICLFGGSLHADVYQWVDAEGVRHYSNTHPPEVAGDVSVLIKEAESTETGARSAPDESIPDHRGSAPPLPAPPADTPPAYDDSAPPRRVTHEHIVRVVQERPPPLVEPVYVVPEETFNNGPDIIHYGGYPAVGYRSYGSGYRSYAYGRYGSSRNTYRRKGYGSHDKRYRHYRWKQRPHYKRRVHHYGGRRQRGPSTEFEGGRQGRHGGNWKRSGPSRKRSHTVRTAIRGMMIPQMASRGAPRSGNPRR